MPVESAADRAVFVSSDDFGAAAVFTPSGGGSPVSLSVLLSKGTEGMGGRAGFEAPAYTARVRQDDLAADPTGGTLVVGAQTFVVQAAPQDIDGGFWLLDLVLQ